MLAETVLTAIRSIRFQALSYEHRLHHPWQYRRFFGQSQVIKLSECIIFRVQNDLGHYRLGITLKARGSSIQRNRVKRQVREMIRQQGRSLGSYDYNVVVPGHKRMDRLFAERLGRCLRAELPRALGCS